MDKQDIAAISARLAARNHALDRIFAQAQERALPIGEVSKLMDIIADTKIDLAAKRLLPPSLRVRANLWLDEYYRELAEAIAQVTPV